MVRRASYLLFKSTATSAVVWLLSSASTRAFQTTHTRLCHPLLLRHRQSYPLPLSSIRTIMSSSTPDNSETPRRRSKRGVKGEAVEKENITDDEPIQKKPKGRPKKIKLDEDAGSPPKKKAKGKPKKVKADDSSDDEAPPVKKAKGRPKKVKLDDEDADDSSPKKKKKSKGAKSKVKDDDSVASAPSTAKATKKPAKRTKAPDHQRLTERDELTKLWDAKEHEDTSYTFKIASWNVAGIRALLRNSPETIPNLCRAHDLDVLCLQETKLQEVHVDDPKLKIREVLKDDYDSYWSCSTAKKGYSGTAVFVKKRADKGSKKKKQATLDGFFGGKKTKKEPKTEILADSSLDADFVQNLIPTDVSYKMGVEVHDQEGRLVHVEFPLFSLTNVYVPNSGQKLERLDYRTEQWDKDFLKFVLSNNETKPTLWLGDLNVAHTNLEVWNDGAKHLAKQAGVTEQERTSFTEQLEESGFQDAFRALHPDAKGCYTYWSQRAGNREPNKGLRLDYFCCSPKMMDESKQVVVRDTYVLYDVHGSDHCPVVLELEIKKE